MADVSRIQWWRWLAGGALVGAGTLAAPTLALAGWSAPVTLGGAGDGVDGLSLAASAADVSAATWTDTPGVLGGNTLTAAALAVRPRDGVFITSSPDPLSPSLGPDASASPDRYRTSALGVFLSPVGEPTVAWLRDRRQASYAPAPRRDLVVRHRLSDGQLFDEKVRGGAIVAAATSSNRTDGFAATLAIPRQLTVFGISPRAVSTSTFPGNAREVGVGIDRKGTIVTAWIGTAGAVRVHRERPFAFSRDDSIAPASEDALRGLTVGVDAEGRATITWIRRRAGQDELRTSVVLPNRPPTPPRTIVRQSHIIGSDLAVSPAGPTVLAWTTRVGTRRYIEVTSRGKAPRQWSPIQRLGKRLPGNASAPSVAQTRKAGYVAWLHEDASGNQSIHVARSNGFGWARSRVAEGIDERASIPPVIDAVGDRAIVGWGEGSGNCCGVYRVSRFTP